MKALFLTRFFLALWIGIFERALGRLVAAVGVVDVVVSAVVGVVLVLR